MRDRFFPPNARCVDLRFKRTFTLPLPKHQRLFAFLAAQLGRDGEERAVERGAIIVREFDLDAALAAQKAAN